MRPKVPERIARERVARLAELAASGREAYERSWEGKTVRAIVERGTENGMERALTENYLSVLIPRITSYNVCYTKLLRPRYGRDRATPPKNAKDPGPSYNFV